MNTKYIFTGDSIMPKPAILKPYFGHYTYEGGKADFLRDTQAYAAHLAECKAQAIPVVGKHGWKEGDELEKDKDFRVVDHYPEPWNSKPCGYRAITIQPAPHGAKTTDMEKQTLAPIDKSLMESPSSAEVTESEKTQAAYEYTAKQGLCGNDGIAARSGFVAGINFLLKHFTITRKPNHE